MRYKPPQGFHFRYVIDLLELLKEKRTASYIYLHSTMRYKATLLRMLNWLERKKFINVKRVFLKKTQVTPIATVYIISQKGQTLLEYLK